MFLIPLGFLDFGFRDLIETLIIAAVLFYLYWWIRGTFAVPVFFGVIIIFLINALVSIFGLTTIEFALRRLIDVGVLAVIIIFQPEIRKLLYNIGRNTSLDNFMKKHEPVQITDEVVEAVKEMARKKIGALIVFARNNAPLNDLVDQGVKLNAKVTHELLVTIFSRETELHDGAVVIRNNLIETAGCFLPISQNRQISSTFGTRHRAALGVTEINDVFVIVVSEETGRISVAYNGKLTSGLTIQKLRNEMEYYLGKTEESVAEESGFTEAEKEK